MPELQQVTHFEQFADNLEHLTSELQKLENRLYALCGKINAPRHNDSSAEPVNEAPKSPDGLFYRYQSLLQELAGVCDVINRHVSDLEEAI